MSARLLGGPAPVLAEAVSFSLTDEEIAIILVVLGFSALVVIALFWLGFHLAYRAGRRWTEARAAWWFVYLGLVGVFILANLGSLAESPVSLLVVAAYAGLHAVSFRAGRRRAVREAPLQPPPSGFGPP